MSVKRFSDSEWSRGRSWLNLFRATRYRGASINDLLYATMGILVRNLRSGALKQTADAIIAANPPPPNWNTSDRALLGWWKFGAVLGPFRLPKLVIHGPGAGIGNALGQSIVGGHNIELNYPVMIEWANANRRVFPVGAANDVTCQRRMRVFMGATIIHEIMHCLGFDHVAHPGIPRNLTHPYWRSVPELAEFAFFSVNAGRMGGTMIPLILSEEIDEFNGPKCATERTTGAFEPATDLAHFDNSHLTDVDWLGEFLRIGYDYPISEDESLTWSFQIVGTNASEMDELSTGLTKSGYDIEGTIPFDDTQPRSLMLVARSVGAHSPSSLQATTTQLKGIVSKYGSAVLYSIDIEPCHVDTDPIDVDTDSIDVDTDSIDVEI